MDLSRIRYRDLAQRELEERKRLRNRLNQLDRTARSRGGSGDDEPIYFTVDEKAERDLLYRILLVLKRRPREVVDPVWVAARDLFNDKPGLLGLFSNEYLGNPEGDLYAEPPGVALTRRIKTDGQYPSSPLPEGAAVDCALTIGLLLADQVTAPRLVLDIDDLRGVTVGLSKAASAASFPGNGSGEGPDGIEDREDDDTLVVHADRNDPTYADFKKAFYRVQGEAQTARELARRVLNVLALEGEQQASVASNERVPVVDAEEFARVIRILVDRGVSESEPQLRRKVTEALDRVQNVDYDDVVSEIGIDLPDLEEAASNEIVADNVRLMGPVIAAAMLDELKAFQVVDRILEQAQAGVLPIGQGKAGKLLYKRWKEAPNRISEPERRNVYAMTMGQPGGDPNGNVNREFNELWLRFVSSVSSFVRQHDVDRLLRASLPSAIGHQQVRKAARDLATNLSLHGYGMTYYAALELQGEVKSMIELLQDPEIRASFGAKDMWQVIDTVATTDLGGARTSSRYRTLATCGAIITAWLANNVQKIMRPTGVLIDINEVRSPMPRSEGKKATTNPTDYDLVNACELWLADTATSDTRVDELSQPRESPVMTSKPVPIPAFAREFLDELPGLSMGARGANGVGVRH